MTTCGWSTKAQRPNGFIVVWPGQQGHLGMEATGGMRWFERLLRELGGELWVGDPVKVRAAAARKAKTDKQDAELLLRLLLEKRFPRIWVPTVEQRDARATSAASAPVSTDTDSSQESVAGHGEKRRTASPTAGLEPGRTKGVDGFAFVALAI